MVSGAICFPEHADFSMSYFSPGGTIQNAIPASTAGSARGFVCNLQQQISLLRASVFPQLNQRWMLKHTYCLKSPALACSDLHSKVLSNCPGVLHRLKPQTEIPEHCSRKRRCVKMEPLETCRKVWERQPERQDKTEGKNSRRGRKSQLKKGKTKKEAA